MLWVLVSTAQLQPPTPEHGFREECRRVRSVDSSQQPQPYTLFPRQLFAVAPERPPHDANSEYHLTNVRPLPQHLLPGSYRLLVPPSLSDAMMEMGFTATLALGTTPAEAADNPVVSAADSDAVAHPPPAAPTLPPAQLSQAGTEAHEALLAVLHATEARLCEQAGGLSVDALPVGVAMPVAATACRDALCGLASSVLFEEAAASAGDTWARCQLHVRADARLHGISRAASHNMLQPFAETGSRMRRLQYCIAQLEQTETGLAGQHAIAHLLADYYRLLRAKVCVHRGSGTVRQVGSRRLIFLQISERYKSLENGLQLSTPRRLWSSCCHLAQQLELVCTTLGLENGDAGQFSSGVALCARLIMQLRTQLPGPNEALLTALLQVHCRKWRKVGKRMSRIC